MKNLLLPVALLAVLSIGCGVGNAPAGMSADEAKANFEKQSPEEQIKLIESSPASPEEKQQRIAEIRQKNNLPAPAGSAPAGAAPAAPQGGPGGGASFPGDPRAGGGAR